MKYLCCSTCGSVHVSQQQRPAGLQIAGSGNKSNYIGSHSNTTRTNYRARVVLRPSLLAGGRRAWRCTQLVVARTLHCSCAVCCLWCLGYVQKS